jgi:hypothetical protein
MPAPAEVQILFDANKSQSSERQSHLYSLHTDSVRFQWSLTPPRSRTIAEMAYLQQNHEIQGGAEQRKHYHRYSDPVLVKAVHGCSGSGAHREGAHPNHKPEAVNSGKEGADALKNRKKEPDQTITP